jgi:hypothetical protein
MFRNVNGIIAVYGRKLQGMVAVTGFAERGKETGIDLAGGICFDTLDRTVLGSSFVYCINFCRL